MRWRVPTIVALALFLAVSCDQQPVDPTADQIAESPTFNFTRNTDAGPRIIRGDDMEVGWFLTDVRRGISAAIGVDVREFCLGNFELALVDFQHVYIPRENLRIKAIEHGDDLPASAWPFTYWDCGRFLTETPLAEGTVDYRFTDNDVETWMFPDTKNKNAFGWRVHGAFNAVSNCVWDGYDMDTIKCVDRIVVHP